MTAQRIFPSNPLLWQDFIFDNPRGLHFRHAGVRVATEIVRHVQRLLPRYGWSALVAMGEPNAKGEPTNIIIFDNNDTALVPVKFGEKVIRVGGKSIFVGHDGGVMLLVRSIGDAIEGRLRVLEDKK